MCQWGRHSTLLSFNFCYACRCLLLTTSHPLAVTHIDCQGTTSWSKYDKGKAVGAACKRCTDIVKLAYSHLTWSEVCLKAKVNAQFRKEILSCFKVYDGSKKVNFYPQNVEAATVQGYRVCRELLFLASQDMVKMCGLGPSEVGLEEQQILDENNVPLKGVVISNNNFPLRRLQVFGSYSTNLIEDLTPEEQMLRKDQNKDMHSFLVREAVKARPKPMRSPVGVLSWEAVQKRVADHKAKASLEPAAENAQAPADEQAARAPLAEVAVAEVKKEEDADGAIGNDESESEAEAGLPVSALAGVPKPKQKRTKKERAPRGKKRGADNIGATAIRRRLSQKGPAGL